MMAYDQVDVQLVGPQPTPPPNPHIQINSPTNNSTVNTTYGFPIFGTASGTSENNVIVRVLDSSGQILRQIVTIVDANGNWNVNTNLLIANGTRGSIYAFSTSPRDGSDGSVTSSYESASSRACRWTMTRSTWSR